MLFETHHKIGGLSDVKILVLNMVLTPNLVSVGPFQILLVGPTDLWEVVGPTDLWEVGPID